MVEGLRVLGMRATPAELHPGQSARLEALVVDPARPGKRNTVIWLGCDPDPLDLGRSACSDPKVLGDPSALGQPSESGAPPQLPPGMHAIGLNELAAYHAPADTFSQLPEGDLRRLKGTVAQVLAFAVAEEVSPAATPAELSALLERVRSKEVPSLIALFRIRITEDTTLNQNPALTGLRVDDEPLPEGATLRFSPGSVVKLEATVPDEAFEEYDELQPEGTVHKTERLIAAWYSTWGRFSEPRVALRTEGVEHFTAPGNATEPLPEESSGDFYLVVRDTRGGQTWAQLPAFTCDASLPAPSGLALEPSGGPGDGTTPLALSGSNLGSVLDVLVGGKALGKAAYSSARDRFEGSVPRLEPGLYPVSVRGKHCADLDTGLSYRVF